VAAGKLADGLDRLLPDEAERVYISLRVGRLLGVPVAGDDGDTLSREDLFAGWRLFFERLAADNPVVLLVEDAQYADSGLLDFLDYLIDCRLRLCPLVRPSTSATASSATCSELADSTSASRTDVPKRPPITAKACGLRRRPEIPGAWG